MPKKITKKKSTKKLVDVFSVSINLGGQIFEAKGATALEALSKLNTGLVKSKGILVLSHGGKQATKVLTRPFVKRMIHNKTACAIYANQLIKMLK